MAEEFRVLRPREYHSQLVSKGRRADGRTLDEAREVKLEIDAIKTADASSLVKLGNTSLVCGCTSQILKLHERNEHENQVLKIKVDLPPICSSPTTGYKTQHTAQLLTRTLKNILDDARCLDQQDFFIPETDLFWSIDIEVICLNYDGCLLDAALIAILSALKSLTLSCRSSDIPDRVVKLNSSPVCSSFGMIGDRLVADPNLEEESVAQSTFSITIDSPTNRCCHVSKTGGKSLSSSDLFKCIKLAQSRAAKLKPIIDTISSPVAMDCI